MYIVYLATSEIIFPCFFYKYGEKGAFLWSVLDTQPMMKWSVTEWLLLSTDCDRGLDN